MMLLFPFARCRGLKKGETSAPASSSRWARVMPTRWLLPSGRGISMWPARGMHRWHQQTEVSPAYQQSRTDVTEKGRARQQVHDRVLREWLHHICVTAVKTQLSAGSRCVGGTRCGITRRGCTSQAVRSRHWRGRSRSTEADRNASVMSHRT